MKDESQEKQVNNGTRKRHVKLVVVAVVVLGVLTGGVMLWYGSKAHVKTDDAFIASHVHLISPRIAGHVQQVLVEDNQPVRRGDLLVQLDPVDYQVGVERAEALLMQAEDETSGHQAGVAQARAAVAQAQAHVDQAQLDLNRGEALYDRQVIPREQLDRLRTAQRVVQAGLKESREGLRRAETMVGRPAQGMDARVALRQAELKSARLDLSYTRIVAPVDGYVTRKNAEIGNNVREGQPLLAVVELDQPWIVANYKEGQLSHMRPGQQVEFTVDGYPGNTFSGRVDSIMAGTGAAFSLLPPENATGNYVKVVQRVPVKIVIDQTSDPLHLLRVGMSVEPTIHTGLSLGEALTRLNPFAGD